MKTLFTLAALLFSTLLSTSVPGFAETAKAAPEVTRELSVVVVENLDRSMNHNNTFDRIDRVFSKVFEQRKWPVKIAVERLASNTPAHDTELRVFHQGIFEESYFDLTFRAWMTLSDHGKRWDLGVIKFSYYPRMGQHKEDVLDNVVKGAAEIAADRIEAILFPKPEVKKR